jgi:hypothetical protein
MSFDAVNGLKLFPALPQPDSQTSHLIFLRGWQSPEWLRILGAHCHIDPEFFRQHLDFVRHKEFFDLPPLPSASHEIWRLRVTTICSRHYIQKVRGADAEVVEEHQRDLSARGVAGTSIIRRYAVHDEKTSTIEQDISISVRQRKSGGWFGKYADGYGSSELILILEFSAVVWLDSGNPLDDNNLIPRHERDLSNRKPYMPSYLPVIQHRAKIALNYDELQTFTETDRPTTPAPQLGAGKPLQSSCLLPFQYGVSLDRDLMRIDALYALSDIFAFAASAENQFINLMQKQVDGAIREFRGQEEWSMAALRYSKDLLDDHIQHLESTIARLETEDRTNLPRAQDSPGLETRKATLDQLLEDFRYLLVRSKAVATRAKEGTDTIMNDVLLKESRNAFTQAKEVGRLSFLAYFFLPMSFVTSLFGMNVVQISDWRLAVAAILTVFVLVMAVSVVLGLWESMPWKARKSRMPPASWNTL